MKILSYNGKYLADKKLSGLTEAWSEKRCDAEPLTDSELSDKIKVLQILVPLARIVVDDAGPECVGRQVSNHRYQEIRSLFIVSETLK